MSTQPERFLKVWHKEKHDDYDVTRIDLPGNLSAAEWVDRTRKRGGFWHNEKQFVLWHSVSYIELEATK